MIPKITSVCDQQIKEFEAGSKLDEEGKIDCDIFYLINNSMSKGIVSCLLGCDFHYDWEGEPFNVLIKRSVDAVALQSQDPLSILFKEQYLKVNLT